MTRRINVMIDDDTWGVLVQAPTRLRSRIINDALRAWVTRRRRHMAAQDMDVLRKRLLRVGAEEVALWTDGGQGGGRGR